MPDSLPVMYGIANCDTIRKARNWLKSNDIDYQFHDYKKNGTDIQQLTDWVLQLGWQQLINKRGTTWRKLAEDTRSSMNDQLSIQLMTENPSIIKRPLLVTGNKIILGFKENIYQQEFALK